MTVIKALPATTSYAVGFGVSSKTPPTDLRSRRVVVAKAEPSDKSVEIMRKFSEQYARRSDTYFCVDKSVTSVVIKLFEILVDDGKITISKFDGKEFGWRKMQIEALSYPNELDTVLESEKPEKMSQAALDKMNKKHKAVIMLSSRSDR